MKSESTGDKDLDEKSGSDEIKNTDRVSPALYGTTIALSAFLMFQVQLILSKFILPRFGGGPSVWNTSLLVFQVLLLGGYGYAALLCARFNPKLQGKIHLMLLAGAAVVIVASAALGHSLLWSSGFSELRNGGNPVWQIVVLLSTTVGFQCVLLSATSPLLQRWISKNNSLAIPYRLYAISNLGSMLGLLSYPFLVERFLKLSVQAWVWTAGYLVFLLSAAMCAFIQARHGNTTTEVIRRKHKKLAEVRPRFLWLSLSGCGSIMLLATTNLICQQVAVIPLLWVLPLSLYLLSFILCFDHPRWYRRDVFHPLYIGLTLLALKIMPSYAEIMVTQLLLIFCSAMFVVCMVCHGELARLKPEPQYLTSFYLMVGTGGALGSAFVVLLAPRIFDRFWEFQIALLGCGALVITTLVKDKNSWVHRWRYGWGLLLAAATLLIVGTYVFTSNLQEFEGEGDIVVWRARNFFGMKTVLRMPEGLFLVHGHVLHGAQNSNPVTRNEPTSYYSRQSGIGLLLGNYPRPFEDQGLRVGVVGMGAGTLAAYGRTGDYFRFYEIDPSITGLSQGPHPIFTFLRSSSARADVVLGDARLMMQDEISKGEPQNFDVLVVDAFSGDAIPVHLLTREAVRLYMQHLRGTKSVLAFHISNTALDLRPVVTAISDDLHLASIEIYTPQGDQPLWVLASRDENILRMPALIHASQPVRVSHSIGPWTDDYSNLFELFQTSWTDTFYKRQ